MRRNVLRDVFSAEKKGFNGSRRTVNIQKCCIEPLSATRWLLQRRRRPKPPQLAALSPSYWVLNLRQRLELQLSKRLRPNSQLTQMRTQSSGSKKRISVVHRDVSVSRRSKRE